MSNPNIVAIGFAVAMFFCAVAVSQVEAPVHIDSILLVAICATALALICITTGDL